MPQTAPAVNGNRKMVRMTFPRAACLLALAASALPAADVLLQVSGITGRDGGTKPALTLNAAALTALPRTKARVADHTYEGVLLCEILKHAGQPLGENLRGPLLTRFVMVTAHDGYRALFSLAELDPDFGNSGAFLADTVDSHPLEGKQAPLSIVIPAEKRHPRWVYGVAKIEVMSAPEPVR